MIHQAFLAALAVSIAAGCGGGGATGKVDYSVTAGKNYQQGLAELEEKDWVAAAKYFSFVKARFPYSKFAVLAELRLADAEFGAGHHLQAIDGYKLFIKFHPTHDMVVNGYAAYRIGEAYLEMLPGDWWILPPSYEKDQSATADAHRELTTFLKKYPKSPYVAKARKAVRRVNERLARHELYVARFYWKKNRPMATVLRLRRLLEHHGGTQLDGDALFLLGQAYEKVDMTDRARQTYSRLIEEYPKHQGADQARKALARLAG
jgi:outer membrane protein assembly factor BamD